MKKYIFFTTTLLIILSAIATACSSATTNASIAEVDSLMNSHYNIADAINHNGHCYEDAIDLSDLETYYKAFKQNPTRDNYDAFITEDARISKYEEELVADF